MCTDINYSEITSIKANNFCRIRPSDTTTSFKLIATYDIGAISYMAIGC